METGNIKQVKIDDVQLEMDELNYGSIFFNLFKSNRFTPLFEHDTVLEPKWKKIMHFWLFFIISYLMIVVLFVWNREISLINYYTDHIGNLIGYSFAALGISNLVVIIFNLINRESSIQRSILRSGAAKGQVDLYDVDSIVKKDILKMIYMFILNVALSCILFYFACGFAAYWKSHRGVVEVCLAILYLVDFIIFDILLNLLLAKLYKSESRGLFKVLNIIKWSRCI